MYPRGALYTIEALLVTVRVLLITYVVRLDYQLLFRKSARASAPNRTEGTAEMEPTMFSTKL